MNCCQIFNLSLQCSCSLSQIWSNIFSTICIAYYLNRKKCTNSYMSFKRTCTDKLSLMNLLVNVKQNKTAWPSCLESPILIVERVWLRRNQICLWTVCIERHVSAKYGDMRLHDTTCVGAGLGRGWDRWEGK